MSAKPISMAGPIRAELHWSLATVANSSTTVSMLLVDLLALSSVFLACVAVRHWITPGYSMWSLLQFIPCVVAGMVAMWFNDLYPGVLIHPAEEMRRIFWSVTTVFLVMSCASFLWRTAEAYSRSVFLIAWSLTPAVVVAARYGTRSLFSRHSWWGVPALLLGSGSSARRVVRALATAHRGIRIAGVLTDDYELVDWNPEYPPLLGSLAAAPLYAKSSAAQYAIVATPPNASLDWRETINTHCSGFSHVVLIPEMMGLCSLGVSVKEIGGEVGLELPQRLFQRRSVFSKRALDLGVSIFALLALSPILLILALAVKLSSHGPVFFGQKRCGRNNHIFNALKFRSMVLDSERVLAAHLASHPEAFLEWQRDHKLKDDPRITALGKMMRKYSLDELPQVLNVIVGQMSLVGPRPIVEAEIPRYGRCFSLYERVRPGITGLWQVSGRNNTSYPERVTLDEFYVSNWSVWLDFYILVRTVKVVWTTEGAY